MPILLYIDPGSGSLLIQALLAALLAIPFLFRRTIGNAWHRLRGGGKTDPPDDSDDRPSDP